MTVQPHAAGDFSACMKGFTVAGANGNAFAPTPGALDYLKARYGNDDAYDDR